MNIDIPWWIAFILLALFLCGSAWMCWPKRNSKPWAIWMDEKGVLHSSSYGEGIGTVTVGDANRPTGVPITDGVQYVGYGGGGGGDGSCAVPAEYQQGTFRFGGGGQGGSGVYTDSNGVIYGPGGSGGRGGGATINGVYYPGEPGKGGADGEGVMGIMADGVFVKMTAEEMRHALGGWK